MVKQLESWSGIKVPVSHLDQMQCQQLVESSPGQHLEPVYSDLSTAAKFSATVRRLIKPCYSASVQSVLHQISRSVLTASHHWHTIRVNGGTRFRVAHHQIMVPLAISMLGINRGGEGLETKIANRSASSVVSTNIRDNEISLQDVCSIALCEPDLLPYLLVSF